MFGAEVGRVDRIDVGAQLAAQHAGEISRRLDRVDLRELRLERAQAMFGDAGLIHEGGVVVGNLAFVGAGGILIGWGTEPTSGSMRRKGHWSGATVALLWAR